MLREQEKEIVEHHICEEVDSSSVPQHGHLEKGEHVVIRIEAGHIRHAAVRRQREAEWEL